MLLWRRLAYECHHRRRDLLATSLPSTVHDTIYDVIVGPIGLQQSCDCDGSEDEKA